jgi:hypothetical protein
VNMYLKCCKSNKKKRSPQMIFKSKEQWTKNTTSQLI